MNEFERLRIRTGATFSKDKTFRYELWREWGNDHQELLFIMCNPSIADEVRDDPTQRRVRGYAKAWGYEGYTVANIFALVSTDPRKLKQCPDPVGPENDAWLIDLHLGSKLTVAAWGTWGKVMGRGAQVAEELSALGPLSCLGRNADGSPKHPLYLRKDLKPVPYVLS